MRKGLLEADKAEGLADADVDLFVGDVLLDQLVGDIVADGEGVEESALLKDHADAGAQGEEVSLGHGGDLFAEEADASLVGLEQSVAELEQNALADAGGAEKDARFPGRDGEGDVVENRRTIEGDGDIAEGNDGTLVRGRIQAGLSRFRLG